MEDEMLFGDQLEETDAFELDEDVVNEINNDSFEGEKLSAAEMMDAITAMDIIADTILAENGGEHDEIEPEKVLQEIEDFVSGKNFDEMMASDEVAEDEADNLPAELENSCVRVVMGEDGVEVEAEAEPEVSQAVTDGELNTVYTTDEVLSADEFPLEEDKEVESAMLLSIGNSKATKFRKGYFVLSSKIKKSNKRAWSAAYKKVRKLIGSRKMSAADWAIVAFIANCKMKVLKNSIKRVLSAYKESEKMKKILSSAFVKSSENTQLNGGGNNAIDNASQSENEMKPQSQEGEQQTDKVNENENADNNDGELKEPFGNVPAHDNPTTEDSQMAEQEYAELHVPVANAYKGVVLRKLTNGVYRVVGTRISSSTSIKLEAIERPKKGELKNSCPLKSGTIISVSNGKAVLIKNSNTAGVLAFYGNYVKSSNVKVPYYATAEEGKELTISASKKGTDMFAKGEQIWQSLVLEDVKAKAEKGIASKLTKEFDVRRKQIEIANAKKNAKQSVMNSADKNKFEEMLKEKERERLFQSNKQVTDQMLELEQAQQQVNLDFQTNLLNRMF